MKKIELDKQGIIRNCLLFFLLSCGSLHAQRTDTQGTDFWLAFGTNTINFVANIDMQIRIVGGEQDAKVTIHYTELDSFVYLSVAAHSVLPYRILSIPLKTSVYNEKEGKSKRSIHITSTTPISVYALNQCKETTDATNVLPVTALGIDYYHISYTPLYAPKDTLKDAYIVIATQNNTTIQHHNGATMTLNRGELYYHLSNTDMTGNHITSDKPIAYFVVQIGRAHV